MGTTPMQDSDTNAEDGQDDDAGAARPTTVADHGGDGQTSLTGATEGEGE